MKGLAKVFALSALAFSLAGCSDPFASREYETVQKDAVQRGVTAQGLDDTKGAVSNAIIYAPVQYKSGSDTIAEIHVGSVRACFTQMTDAASVNPGSYRIDCIGSAGNIVARFATESGEYQTYRDPAPGQKKGVRELRFELNNRQLQ